VSAFKSGPTKKNQVDSAIAYAITLFGNECSERRVQTAESAKSCTPPAVPPLWTTRHWECAAVPGCF
jgi:hypothetical protein